MFRSKFFTGFSSEECNEFIAYANPTKRILHKDEILTDEGIVVDSFGILLMGRLKGAKYRYDGALDLIDIYTKSEIVHLDTICTPSRVSPIQISAMEDSEVFLFDRNTISPDNLPKAFRQRITTNVINMLANESVKKLYKIDVLYKKALRERIMVYLRHMESHLERSEFHIRMDREQFAQYLGVNRSALSHELSLMRKEGIIEFKKDYFRLLKPRTQD